MWTLSTPPTEGDMNELELRKPDFAGGVPIRLADGQEWHFPVPMVEMCPKFVDGRPKMWSATSFGPEFDDLVQAISDAEPGPDELLAIWSVAAFMLRLNYSLDDAAFSKLFRHRWGDEATLDVISRIIDVSAGRGPKASPVGDDSP